MERRHFLFRDQSTELKMDQGLLESYCISEESYIKPNALQVTSLKAIWNLIVRPQVWKWKKILGYELKKKWGCQTSVACSLSQLEASILRLHWLSITNPNLPLNSQQLSFIVGNVGARFCQERRMCGKKNEYIFCSAVSTLILHFLKSPLWILQEQW